jgi:hypothetical protein
VNVVPGNAWRDRRGSTSAPADPGVCDLVLPGSDSALSKDCLTCHGRLAHGGHPYDFEYLGLNSTSAASPLRTRDEAIRRGVFLPDREVRCVTCHDRVSPWKYHIRLPRDAKVTHAVDLKRPVTYENPGSLAPPRPGDDVGRKPLCLGCHALD